MKTNIHFYHISLSSSYNEKFFRQNCRENKKLHLVFNKVFFFENRSIYEIMWKNIVKPNRPQMTIRRMRITCWMLKATNTTSEYVLHIAFPLQQWLQ